MGVRAVPQALAKHGLNYVIEKYLLQKLKKAASGTVVVYPYEGNNRLDLSLYTFT